MFGRSDTGFTSITKYYKEAGIKKKASVHTLRHTFSTHQIHNGLKINQLKEVLGHRRMETTYKYVHLDRTNLRQELFLRYYGDEFSPEQRKKILAAIADYWRRKEAVQDA